MKLQSKRMTACFTVLLAVSLIGCGGSERQVIDSSKFKDSTYCEKCHRDIYGQWTKSPHNYSYNDPIYQKLYLLADKETKGKAEETCAGSVCHAPVGSLAGEIPPADGSKLSEIAKEGIFCDFCHTVSDMEKVGNGLFVMSPGKVKRGPFEDAVSPVHETEYSRMHTEARFCGICHNFNHPVNDLPLITTFTEWEDSQYNTGDPETSTACQDCHMTPGPGEKGNNPGIAASLGPNRNLIFTHNIVGANIALAQIIGSPTHAQLAEERLKSAASISINNPPTAEKGTSVPVEVTVKNIGAGHMLPTGVTELRQMWVQVTATDSSGNFIYSSGFLDSKGNVDDKCTMFNTVFADLDGKKTSHSWLAEKVISDNRIPPGESKSEKFEIKIPKDTSGQITIDVKLRYRSAPQDLIYELLDSEAKKLPITDMASSRAVITIP